MEEMKAAARAQGLWNLWISPNLADCMRDVVAEASESGLLGAGLSNLVGHLLPMCQEASANLPPCVIERTRNRIPFRTLNSMPSLPKP